MSLDHNLTGELVLRNSYDPDSKSLRANLGQSMEMSIELNHADGDSVTAHAPSIVITEAEGAINCQGMKTICMYGSGSVEVSPDDSGDVFYAIANSPLLVFNICARRIRIIGSGKVVING